MSKKAVIGGGCFWCIEAIVQRLVGVEKVVSGYAGGNIKNPTYREVCSGLTGHVEVVEITYDPEKISYHDLLIVFMTSHDPTTLNRQGADKGTQYRSIILYSSEEEKEVAEKVIQEVSGYYEDPIVTELQPLDIFYAAEEDHQNYYNNNSEAGYCRIVIDPKIAKLKKAYADKLAPRYG